VERGRQGRYGTRCRRLRLATDDGEVSGKGSEVSGKGELVSYRLAGKVALVFGAGSSGERLSNGRAAALAFARHGASVAAIDVRLAEAERTAAEIRRCGGTAVAIRADVTREDEVAAAVAEAAAALGDPTVLHNNVGVASTGGLADLDRAGWDAALAVNVTGVFLTCKHTVPRMLAAGGGAIVNVSSVAGIRHLGYDYPAYMAAKAAVNQLTVALALTYADRGIRVNAVLPGLIDTPLVERQLVGGGAGGADPAAVAAARADRDARSPTGRAGSPWDVANAAVFLASDEAGYINGVCLPVDGGLSARAA
jgi:NAD(P)-dependent dehydrogenase (short-subunit alcohol dehydrogenase family)